MSSKDVLVAPSGDKWSVRKVGAERATALCETQQEAIAKAKEIAVRQGAELYIHGRDGRIRERSSYRGSVAAAQD